MLLASCTETNAVRVPAPDLAAGCYAPTYDAKSVSNFSALAAEIHVPPLRLIDQRIVADNPWKTVEAVDPADPIPSATYGWLRINHLLVILFLDGDTKSVFMDLRDSKIGLIGTIYSIGGPRGRTPEFPIELIRKPCDSFN
ncbi:MAG TPA: hypothetical protein VH082_03525 [Rudaea sp.]|jgi:hypothetical protein|nr:hypothetical protein [Rudaea sp.]